MPVLGYNITKVEMEKLTSNIPPGQIEVKLSPKIEELRLGEIRTPTGKMNGIEVLFDYQIEYNPQIARASVKGSILYMPPQKDRVDDILTAWEDEKKLDSVLLVEVVNFLSMELTPMLIVIAKEMRLPYHVPIPRAELRTQ
ncbi:hypothetical protein [Thermococcus sp. 21S9]|uniref:hypothetical protein n=1 Tax=Thermococcus sp. 21S9 TaxID=1638223 RepID=UPI001439D5C2|nr:hypothetical protein [Thermococcus sp. 21S9]NJE53633.1 hypothetical protein [Thermococcus sp. 21S9]